MESGYPVNAMDRPVHIVLLWFLVYSSYLIGRTALVKRAKRILKGLRKLNSSVTDGSVSKLDAENMHSIETYRSNC